jgi:tartrate dehydrogenase/decarboxylase/D-malate dehydrogenase
MKTHKIAIIAGDGIGKEVMPEGIRAVDAAALRFGINIEWTTFDWANCDYYAKHGKMMPDDWKAQLQSASRRSSSARSAAGRGAGSYFAVGLAAEVPPRIRPVREPAPGAPDARRALPLAGKKPGDIDFYIVRENTEGEYSSVGGKMFEGTDREFVLQEAVFHPNTAAIAC